MPRTARRLIAAAAVAVGVLGTAGCAGTSNGTSVEGGGYQSGSGITTYSVGHRQLVGNVSGTTLAGQQLSLASYRGDVVVVDFWSQGCGPCHAQEQAFESLSKTDYSKGVRFVGIDERDNLDAGRAFERQYHVTYPSLFDRTDAFVLDFPGSAPPSTPTTIVLDRTGHIAARANGALDYTHLRSLIDGVLDDPA
jgi:thiol-disulfide isomerase/thioredoxin